jgi:serine/threonine-protein kinase
MWPNTQGCPRPDALKVLREEESADPEYRAHFNREADLASTLWHPHIVSVHDRGEFNGQLWISMDYIDGIDAARLLASRFPAGMPTDQVVRIITAVASALDYAHKHGLLHRDVKPANIMLSHLTTKTSSESCWPLRDRPQRRRHQRAHPHKHDARNGGVLRFRQLMGEEIDGRADQYALAATAYHLLTGTQLYSHSNPAVVISRHLNSPPPALSDSRPELAALDPALSAAPAKDPANRFERCADFAHALAEPERVTVEQLSARSTARATVVRNLAASKAANQKARPVTPQFRKSQTRRFLGWIAVAARIKRCKDPNDLLGADALGRDELRGPRTPRTATAGEDS